MLALCCWAGGFFIELYLRWLECLPTRAQEELLPPSVECLGLAALPNHWPSGLCGGLASGRSRLSASRVARVRASVEGVWCASCDNLSLLLCCSAYRAAYWVGQG